MAPKATAVLWLAASFAVPTLLLWACGGAMVGPEVCSQRNPCDSGKTCVLGRCRKNKTMPVSTNAPLMRFDPVDLAWVDGASMHGPSDIGDRIVLGEEGHAAAKLYLRFAIAVPPAERVQRAILTLQPLPSCARKPGRMALEVAHILAPWRSADLGAGKRPKLGLPLRAGEASVTPALPLNIDVTEIVKAWGKHRTRYHGIALMAAGNSATGACYSSGLSWGEGPQLKVYLWPDEADAGADADTDDDAGHAKKRDGGS